MVEHIRKKSKQILTGRSELPARARPRHLLTKLAVENQKMSGFRCRAGCLPAQSWFGAARISAGFTLLELVLVFGLSVLVLGAIALAIDLHLRVAFLGRQRVEEAQLARVLLQQIAEDIRAAIPPQSVDVNKLAKTLSSLVESVDSAALEGILGTSGPAPSGSRSSSSAEGNQAGSSSSTASAEEGEQTQDSGETILGLPRSVPGLFGGSDWLQVDVSRLPRPEEYQHYALGTGQHDWELDRLSEVKTVLYGLMIPGSTMSMSHTLVAAEEWGLYRDVVDRATGSLASQQNILDQKVRSTGPLAPEVVWLEFAYFDGSQWYDSWDSETQGGLPVAVEVIIGLDMSRSQLSLRSGQMDVAPAEPTVLYRTVVYLPVAQAASTASTSEAIITEQ